MLTLPKKEHLEKLIFCDDYTAIPKCLAFIYSLDSVYDNKEEDDFNPIRDFNSIMQYSFENGIIWYFDDIKENYTQTKYCFEWLSEQLNKYNK